MINAFEVKDFPSLEKIEVMKDSFNKLQSLTIMNNEKLESIVIEDTFHNVETLVYDST